jgi:hypothetical protein
MTAHQPQQAPAPQPSANTLGHEPHRHETDSRRTRISPRNDPVDSTQKIAARFSVNPSVAVNARNLLLARVSGDHGFLGSAR